MPANYTLLKHMSRLLSIIIPSSGHQLLIEDDEWHHINHTPFDMSPSPGVVEVVYIICMTQ